MSNYYMVRAMHSSENEIKEFVEKGVVAVGWSDLKFTDYVNISELKNAIWNSYYKDSSKRQQSISLSLNQASMFKNIQKGDKIIVPCPYGVLLAEADDGEIYSDSSYKFDLANQHRVKFQLKNGKPKIVARTELPENLQRRLRVRGRSVSNLIEFKNIIDKLFEEDYSFSEQVQSNENSEQDLFKAELLKRIQNGKTYLQTGGTGLEYLVKEIMECEGYKADVLDKKAFPEFADADVKAEKIDRFSTQQFLIQVKHHYGVSNDWGITQLAKIREYHKYDEYDLMFITSASVNERTMQEAEKFGIDVFDGNALVELIYDNLNKLSEETKRRLGISLIPHLRNL